jgi:hypothetical protein
MLKLGRLSRNLLFIGLVACGGDDADEGSKSDNASASGGKGGGGRGGSGSSSAGRGNELPRMGTGTAQAESAYTCQPKPTDSGGAARADSRCCAGMGVCTGDVSDGIANGFPHDTCSADDSLYCLPNKREVMASADDSDAGAAEPMAFAACRVSFPGAPADFPDYEGRCLPLCFAAQNPLRARLSQSSCGAGELCAPCFDPLTGDSTGSCELQGDAPKEKGPEAFADCADGQGYCVPAFAAGMQAGQLAQLTCEEGELCGPKNKVADPNACFARCDSGMFGPGACVPTFLASVGAGILQQADCEAGMVCGPCELFGTRTGVCD